MLSKKNLIWPVFDIIIFFPSVGETNLHRFYEIFTEIKSDPYIKKKSFPLWLHYFSWCVCFSSVDLFPWILLNLFHDNIWENLFWRNIGVSFSCSFQTNIKMSNKIFLSDFFSMLNFAKASSNEWMLKICFFFFLLLVWRSCQPIEVHYVKRFFYLRHFMLILLYSSLQSCLC